MFLVTVKPLDGKGSVSIFGTIPFSTVRKSIESSSWVRPILYKAKTYKTTTMWLKLAIPEIQKLK